MKFAVRSTSVLVVEDHDDLRKSLVSLLQRSGFAADGVFSAEEAMEIAPDLAPDIYVVDIGLPGEDGISLAKQIREVQPRAGIIVLTARTELNTRLESYASGADVYLGKPVDPEELVALLRSLSRRLEHKSEENIQGLCLDLQSNMLSGASARVQLTDAESRVLFRFLFASENVLERWELMEAFATPETPISPRSMEVRIATLRKKVSDASGSSMNPILGVRNFGYRLRVRLLIT